MDSLSQIVLGAAVGEAAFGDRRPHNAAVAEQRVSSSLIVGVRSVDAAGSERDLGDAAS